MKAYFTSYLITYDITNPKRLNKIFCLLKQYCYKCQNSVFEGDLSSSQLMILKDKLKQIVKEEDSIIIYPLTSFNIKNRIVVGIEKHPKRFII